MNPDTFGQTVGIIIQGPLISLTGQIPGNPVKYFGTDETIRQNVEKIRGLGGTVIVSTWDAKTDDEKAVLARLKDSKTPITTTPTPTLNDPDHRYKQRYGVLMGMKALGSKSTSSAADSNAALPDFLVKIRTDMLMPDSFWVWIKQLISRTNSGEKKLGVSELTANMPFFMGDFVYAAPREIFTGFVNCIVGYGERLLHPAIGIDDGLKYASFRGYLHPRAPGRFPQIMRTTWLFTFRDKLMRSVWNRFIANELIVMPRDVWTGIIWRGRPISSFVSPEKFKSDTLPEPYQPLTLRRRIQECMFLFGKYEVCYGKRQSLPFVIQLYSRLMKLTGKKK